MKRRSGGKYITTTLKAITADTTVNVFCGRKIRFLCINQKWFLLQVLGFRLEYWNGAFFNVALNYKF